MNNFFEIKNATFKAGGKDKVKNLSIEGKNEGDIVAAYQYILQELRRYV